MSPKEADQSWQNLLKKEYSGGWQFARISSWSETVLAAKAKKAGRASEDTHLTPSPPYMILVTLSRKRCRSTLHSHTVRASIMSYQYHGMIASWANCDDDGCYSVLKSSHSGHATSLFGGTWMTVLYLHVCSESWSMAVLIGTDGRAHKKGSSKRWWRHGHKFATKN